VRPGKELVGAMVKGPGPGMLKRMVFVPTRALASWMAARSVQMPFPGAVSQTPFPSLASEPSPVEFTINEPAGMSVAVAVGVGVSVAVAVAVGVSVAVGVA
jgi:hypothetical protein